MYSFKNFLVEARYKAWNKPKVGYHGGTNKGDSFTIPSKGTNNFGLLGNIETSRHGAFFSDNPEFSKHYGDVNKYHLHIKNPYNMHQYSKLDFADSIDAHGPTRDLHLAAKHSTHHWQLFDGELGKHFVEWLKSQGHDSAKFHEYNEKDDSQSNTTVVFDPENIKPAHSSVGKIRTKKLGQ